MKRISNLWTKLVSWPNLLASAMAAAPFRDRVVHSDRHCAQFFANYQRLKPGPVTVRLCCSARLSHALIQTQAPGNSKGGVGLLPGDDRFTPSERRRGLPIGNQTSQFFANVYLNPHDHFVLRELRPGDGTPGDMRAKRPEESGRGTLRACAT